MKCRIDSDQGSITIEAALIVPIIIGMLLFFLSFLQIAAARNLLSLSTLRTADMLCKWAPIYKNTGLEEAKNDILTHLGKELPLEIPEHSMALLNQIINLRTIADHTMDYVYGFAAQQLCSYFIREDPFIQHEIIQLSDLNLYKSDFFHNGTSYIRINSSCKVKTYLPFDINIRYSIYCRAWGSGKTPDISTGDPSEQGRGIWAENNFTRGKILRQMYGGNLPDQFPVIAAFTDGTAVSIKSLNHMAQTYQNVREFERTIKEMIDALYAFEGAEFGGISINKGSISKKKLILILPENDFTVSQNAAVIKIMQYAMHKFIEVDLQRYQKV